MVANYGKETYRLSMNQKLGTLEPNICGVTSTKLTFEDLVGTQAHIDDK